MCNIEGEGEDPMKKTIEVEFIICWDNKTWTTKTESYPPADTLDEAKLCERYFVELVGKCSNAEPHGSFTHCSPVHVGIYNLSFNWK